MVTELKFLNCSPGEVASPNGPADWARGSAQPAGAYREGAIM